jgi:MraZ protein
MHTFLGEYEVAIDAKGRFLLPAGLRKQLPEGAGERFVINRGFEACLVLYTMDVWQMLSAKMNKLNDFNQKERAFKRLFLNGAGIVELDSAGRMLLPKNLMEYAGLSKDMILAAQGNKVELWDKEAYQNYMKQNVGGLSLLAEEVGGSEFFNPFAD